MTADEIVQQLHAYKQVATPRKLNSGWYAGITSDPRGRLFTDHDVDEDHDYWLFRQANSVAAARRAEARLHKMGYRGSGGGGDDRMTNYVYAYEITSTTTE